MADNLLTVTESARQAVLGMRDEEPDGQSLALWLEVNGETGGEYTYDLYFERAADASPADAVDDHGGLSVVIPAAHADRLRGATLDVRDEGLVLVNPNRPTPPASTWAPSAEAADLSGPVAQAVIRILAEEINPAIAAHGGSAELVAVEEDVAYLRLGGGCVGCGMARVTLSQGIEVAIVEGVAEISRVVDVTDHASGTNPYFEPAKK
ncbi:MAG TPA: NifU family protein [Acidimicrobiales bacterium]|nr:NifU family protein [Acidimicrobiales bacterium]